MAKPRAAALLVPLALAGAAACQTSSDTTTGATTTQAAPAAASTPATCTPDFDGGTNGSDIAQTGHTLTATVSLDCHDQAPPGPLDVSVALFYRPDTNVSTSFIAPANFNTWQAQYTTSATCKTGLWYIGVVASNEPTRGATIDITNCPA